MEIFNSHFQGSFHLNTDLNVKDLVASDAILLPCQIKPHTTTGVLPGLPMLLTYRQWAAQIHDLFLLSIFIPKLESVESHKSVYLDGQEKIERLTCSRFLL